jgi:hypothetical protein
MVIVMSASICRVLSSLLVLLYFPRLSEQDVQLADLGRGQFFFPNRDRGELL